jgi:hypothetical protein
MLVASTTREPAVSGMDQQDERTQTEEDAKEDLELKDEDADEVRGGDRSRRSDTPFEFLKIEPD